MQIDFHHAVTYTVARLATFGHREAETIAYCAQYVDDATNSGTIKFENNAMYARISSAHKTLDYRNFDELANHFVWIPFHFLPGNGGVKAGENPDGTFVEKIICRPNSYVAKDMIRVCIEERNCISTKDSETVYASDLNCFGPWWDRDEHDIRCFAAWVANGDSSVIRVLRLVGANRNNASADDTLVDHPIERGIIVGRSVYLVALLLDESEHGHTERVNIHSSRSDSVYIEEALA